MAWHRASVSRAGTRARDTSGGGAVRRPQDAKAALKQAEAFTEELAGQLDTLSVMFDMVATEPPESAR